MPLITVESYTQITLEDRRLLEQFIRAKMPVTEIALRLGRHRSTIYREIKRNSFEDASWPELNGYHCVLANKIAQERQARRCKLTMYPELCDLVLDRLNGGWSPEQISGRMRFEGSLPRISHESIYKYAYSEDGRAIKLYEHLPEKRRRRRPRIGRRAYQSQFPSEISIKNRPDDINDRQSFGHWEADLIMFQKALGKANVTTLVERSTRYTLLKRNKNRLSGRVVDGMISLFSRLPQAARKSVTFDRGTEFSFWPKLKQELEMDAWVCDPKAPWQKGTNENTNRRLRRHLPLDTDLTRLAPEGISTLCEIHNSTPRKCLGWRTPTEAFREKLLAEGP